MQCRWWIDARLPWLNTIQHTALQLVLCLKELVCILSQQQKKYALVDFLESFTAAVLLSS